MKNIKPLIVLSILLWGSTATRAANVRITALGGLNLAQLKISPMPTGSTLKSEPALTYGVLFTADFISFVKFDLGFLYKQSVFSMNFQNSSVDPSTKVTYEQFFLPMTARYEFWFFSVGGGVFYTFPFKDKITEANSAGTTISTFDQKLIRNGNFGLVATAGFRYKLPSLPIGFMADCWYLWGVNELSKDLHMQSIRQSDIQILFGISLYLD